MLFRKRITSFFLLLFTSGISLAQIVTLNGYIKDMEGVYLFEKAMPTLSGNEINTLSYNLAHNRLNLRAYPLNNVEVALELRNRIFAGKLLEEIPGYADLIATDDGIADLSWNLVEEEKWFFNTTIDRAYIDYTLGNWQIRAGRQRINWGINLVWNPNDLFNAFSYMDFDYEERPGSDAILLTWYPSFSSSVDVAYKAAKEEKHRTLAAKYRFNLFNYDFQVLAGQSGYDYVLGGGWSGNIGNISCRGEASWFYPLDKFKDESEAGLSATVSLDYSFSNSLYIHVSGLYNSLGTTEKGESFSLIDPTQQLSAKKLSIGKYELFGQISYPIGTLFQTNLATMVNPVDGSMFLAPSVSIWLLNNIDFYLTSQILLGEEGTEYAAFGNLYALYGRLRWSF